MIKIVSNVKCFAGTQIICAHSSAILQCSMRFAIYLPPTIDQSRLPALYWLSGLTCTEENFITKAGAQRVAAELGIILIVPDTSPRGLNIPGENDHIHIGLGAGFYLDAIESPWQQYKMYSYITQELIPLVEDNYPVDRNRVGIFGHSMGGHGALTLAIRNPAMFKSVSAFAPIVSPMNGQWGQDAFTAYLGSDKKTWEAYDACKLIEKHGWSGPAILIDQGTNDPYLQTQLKLALFQETCKKNNISINCRYQDGYDHSYYFISTFIEDHLRYHANNLKYTL
jgi:S-formylglutathione hydrolase